MNNFYCPRVGLTHEKYLNPPLVVKAKIKAKMQLKIIFLFLLIFLKKGDASQHWNQPKNATQEESSKETETETSLLDNEFEKKTGTSAEQEIFPTIKNCNLIQTDSGRNDTNCNTPVRGIKEDVKPNLPSRKTRKLPVTVVPDDIDPLIFPAVGRDFTNPIENNFDKEDLIDSLKPPREIDYGINSGYWPKENSLIHNEKDNDNLSDNLEFELPNCKINVKHEQEGKVEVKNASVMEVESILQEVASPGLFEIVTNAEYFEKTDTKVIRHTLSALQRVLLYMAGVAFLLILLYAVYYINVIRHIYARKLSNYKTRGSQNSLEIVN